MYSQIFSPIKINGLEIRNRTVRSATHEGLADQDGLPTQKLADLFSNMAENNLGLIITGHAFVAQNGKASGFQSAIDNDERIKPWRTLLNSVHAKDGKVFLQLAHAGGMAADVKTAVGPSAFAQTQDKAPCRELTVHEIAGLAENFAAAARRAKKAGFDGVQIHAAHGYLLSQFLSPVYNKRTDSYGGGVHNRARFLYEVITEIRRELGRDFPVAVKINSEDFHPDGFTSDECTEVCKRLEELGVDVVELSGGIPAALQEFSPIRKSTPEPTEKVYYETAAAKIKKTLSIPVMLVGGIRYPDVAERLLRNHICDMVSLSRPLIREPELITKWLNGSASRAACVSCNLCFRPLLTGRGLYCVKDK